MNKTKLGFVFLFSLSFSVLIYYPVQSAQSIPSHVSIGYRNAAYQISHNKQVEDQKGELAYGGICQEFFFNKQQEIFGAEINLHTLSQSVLNQYTNQSQYPRSGGLWVKKEPGEINQDSSYSPYAEDLECGPNSISMVNLKIKGIRIGTYIIPSIPFYTTSLRLITNIENAQQLEEARLSSKLEEKLKEFELIAIDGYTTAEQLESFQEKYNLSAEHIHLVEAESNQSTENLRTKAYKYLKVSGNLPKALVTDSLIAISLYDHGVQENLTKEELIKPLKEEKFTVFPVGQDEILPGFTSEKYVLIARNDAVGRVLISKVNSHIIAYKQKIKERLDNEESKVLKRIKEDLDSSEAVTGGGNGITSLIDSFGKWFSSENITKVTKNIRDILDIVIDIKSLF